eukprot:Lithocolla_globosa_v1_NODE_3337_length_1695_cov_10.600000.p3 type:complete len:105 gc:universal NODE_3337_length_1695_cov_10.600000:401-715(+)
MPVCRTFFSGIVILFLSLFSLFSILSPSISLISSDVSLFGSFLSSISVLSSANTSDNKMSSANWKSLFDFFKTRAEWSLPNPRMVSLSTRMGSACCCISSISED